MNALLTPFRQLVDRKLWPLAILLIAALAAVPYFLAKDQGTETAVTPIASAGTAPAAGGDQSPTQPIVSLGTPAEREAARKVLGSRKNPFKPAGKVQATAASDSSATTTTGGTSGDTKKDAPSSTGGGGGTGTTIGIPSVGVTTPLTPVKKPTYELFQLKIRFGSTSTDDLANRSVKRLTALPAMASPTLIYLGLKRDQRTAVFMVDANTVVVGDGKCVPSPSDCQNLELKKGQTAFVDVLGDGGESTAQYQLDYVKVLRRTTTSAAAARAARRATAKGGRDALRARLSRVNGWNYDPETGVLIAPKKK